MREPNVFDPRAWNFTAKRIREIWPIDLTPTDPMYDEHKKTVRAQQNILIDLAMEFARKFKEDNEEFDPIIFLEHCSPDPLRYPIEELWENAS